MTRIVKTPEERKQEIIEAALLLFSRKGYENTTIQNIADHLNIATGLCYRYFKSKQEIFTATSELYAKKAIKNLQQSSAKNLSTLDQFAFSIKILIEYTINYSDFESNHKEDIEIVTLRLNEIAKQLVDKMIPIIEQGVKENILECSNIPKTLNFLVFGIFAMIHVNVHTNISKEEFKKEALSSIPLVEELCCNVLKIKTPDKLKLL